MKERYLLDLVLVRAINCVLLCTRLFTDRHRRTLLTSSCQSRDYLVVQISDLHTRVTTTCRALLLDLASDLLLSLALRLGTVYHLSWGAVLWTLPLGIIWRRSCSLELMAFLLTLSLGVSRHGLGDAVQPFGWRLGWRCCTASQLVYMCHVFYPFVFTVRC